MKRALAVCMMACSLCACSLLPSPGEPTKKYTLEAFSGGASSYERSHTSSRYQLIVDMPTLYPPIDNTRVSLKPQEQTIDYYADVEWADRLSALIQESLIYSLQSNGYLRGVSRATEGIQADYALKVEVRKFYVDQHDRERPFLAQVNYMVHLVKFPERHVVASRQFTYTQTISEQTMDCIIKSLNIAHLEVSKNLVHWVVEHMR